MRPYPVTLSREATALIRAHARADAPVECCGGLLGRREGAGVRIAAALPTAGAASPHRYAIGPAACLDLEKRAAAAGLELLGFYHSHPAGPALPSASDLELAWPGFVYLIAGGDGTLRAWRLADDRTCFHELALRTGPREDAA